jgi:hypothetical protein
MRMAFRLFAPVCLNLRPRKRDCARHKMESSSKNLSFDLLIILEDDIPSTEIILCTPVSFQLLYGSLTAIGLAHFFHMTI